MKQELIIKDFGPIKDASIELRRYTLFIGTQASGKSTVAKLISIFKDLEFIIDKNCDHKKKFQDYNIDSFFSKSSFLQYSNGSYTITYSDEKFTIKEESHFIESVKKEKDFLEKVLIEHINQVKSKNPKKTLEISDDDHLKQLYNSNWKTFFNISVEQTYIPAERMVLSLVKKNPFAFFNNFALPACITNFGEKFEDAKRTFPVYPIDFLGITFKMEDGKQRVYYDESHSLDLSECASGFQSIIPVLLVIAGSGKNNSFIIEEPESNLFPTAQKQLINFLIKSINQKSKDGDLIITTHSPYILSSLNILLLAYITAKKNIANKEYIANLTPEDTWINPEEFNAFFFSNGTITEIFDRKLNLIADNELDNISDDIGGVYDELFEVYKQTPSNIQ